MLTYNMSDRGKLPLYLYLYQQVKQDIVLDKLPANSKLPSKRVLAQHLKVSINTVQNAYEQLLSEGYLYTEEKKGYFVSALGNQLSHPISPAPPSPLPEPKREESYFYFSSNRTSGEDFPYSVWARQLRQVLTEKDPSLFTRQSYLGSERLRKAIAEHLVSFRNLVVSPRQIIVGAGTEYLYTMLLNLLNKQSIYALEDPGYDRIYRIYHSNGVDCVHLPMDKEGLSITALQNSHADVLHISPSHHFPTGVITPITRRMELIRWANQQEGRYIIEDDYDSEFRFDGKPIPPMKSIDSLEKVIYMNTFSKTISPAIRISYMVLPLHLLEKAEEVFGFASCPVSSFEQHTLAMFIEGGHFERHINRMRRLYRNHRNQLMQEIHCILPKESFEILEEDAGLHFLLKLDTKLEDKELKKQALEKGLSLSFLSDYYYHQDTAPKHRMVISYAGMDMEHLPDALKALSELAFPNEGRVPPLGLY